MYDEFGNYYKNLLKKYCKRISYYDNGNLEFIGEYLNEKKMEWIFRNVRKRPFKNIKDDKDIDEDIKIYPSF